MNSIDERLVEIFRVAFPELSAENAERAAASSLDAWDSLATVTLINLIEEEFDLEIPPDEAAEILSFAGLRDYVKQHQ